MWKIIVLLSFLAFTPVKDESPEVCVAKCKAKYEKCLKRYQEWACEFEMNLCLNRCD